MKIWECDIITVGIVAVVVSYRFNHMQIIRDHMLQSHSVTRYPHTPTGDLAQNLTNAKQILNHVATPQASASIHCRCHNGSLTQLMICELQHSLERFYKPVSTSLEAHQDFFY